MVRGSGWELNQMAGVDGAGCLGSFTAFNLCLNSEFLVTLLEVAQKSFPPTLTFGFQLSGGRGTFLLR